MKTRREGKTKIVLKESKLNKRRNSGIPGEDYRQVECSESMRGVMWRGMVTVLRVL